jgi:hypothetical protein
MEKNKIKHPLYMLLENFLTYEWSNERGGMSENFPTREWSNEYVLPSVLKYKEPKFVLS